MSVSVMCYLMFNESIIKQNVTENVEFYLFFSFFFKPADSLLIPQTFKQQ